MSDTSINGINSNSNQIVYNIQVYDSDLCCPVYFEEFEEPKALTKCLHNICRKCLEDIVNTNHYWRYIECPICRSKSNLPRGGVNKLPTHHFIQRLIDGIPGRKEKKALKSMIEKFEENILKYKQMLVEAQDSLHDASKKADEEANRLKTEISTHAKRVTEIIQENAMDLCSEVDELCKEAYKISEIEDHEKRMSSLLDESVASLLQAQDILKQSLTIEILDQTPVMLDRARNIARSVDALELWFSNFDSYGSHRLVFIENIDLSTGESILGELQDENYSLSEDAILVSKTCTNCRKIERKGMKRMRRLRKKEKCRQKAELRKEFISREHKTIH
ncbi:tripartite motif-containing protein 54-like [Actinia tenebrosa]|uniref:Tripartite motif-containing protein 54-like n=1 Tax=Actinia tenebrosa TaxID=6105 RepID=A0A6P8JD60_ACTTE|nr:tripartite motif-containing protein 54-like [Actinia tenebrosa]